MMFGLMVRALSRAPSPRELRALTPPFPPPPAVHAARPPPRAQDAAVEGDVDRVPEGREPCALPVVRPHRARVCRVGLRRPAAGDAPRVPRAGPRRHVLERDDRGEQRPQRVGRRRRRLLARPADVRLREHEGLPVEHECVVDEESGVPPGRRGGRDVPRRRVHLVGLPALPRLLQALLRGDHPHAAPCDLGRQGGVEGVQVPRRLLGLRPRRLLRRILGGGRRPQPRPYGDGADDAVCDLHGRDRGVDVRLADDHQIGEEHPDVCEDAGADDGLPEGAAAADRHAARRHLLPPPLLPKPADAAVRVHQESRGRPPPHRRHEQAARVREEVAPRLGLLQAGGVGAALPHAAGDRDEGDRVVLFGPQLRPRAAPPGDRDRRLPRDWPRNVPHPGDPGRPRLRLRGGGAPRRLRQQPQPEPRRPLGGGGAADGAAAHRLLGGARRRVRRGERAQVHRDRDTAGGDHRACLGLPPGPTTARLHSTSPPPPLTPSPSPPR